MKLPKYIKVSKVLQPGWWFRFRSEITFVFAITVIIAVSLTAINAHEKQKQQKQFPPREIIYKLELVWENDSIQFFEFRKGSYRGELFYDKINKRWFR